MSSTPPTLYRDTGVAAAYGDAQGGHHRRENVWSRVVWHHPSSCPRGEWFRARRDTTTMQDVMDGAGGPVGPP
jgi:hypothetical protein